VTAVYDSGDNDVEAMIYSCTKLEKMEKCWRMEVYIVVGEG